MIIKTTYKRSSLYGQMIGLLINFNEKELENLFFDIDNIELIKRISECANNVIEKLEKKK